ncbi:transporter substrate-binding domain-containing protein [Halocynthiibacter namhaensis]|uniref:transporter substrate-binding domain-containing protein n=1 Tax=Halocynthiibacter namhaensis TaxID=1290553 RepID=UPI000579574F|nr:transporter substrate-binding domain-containing protein [Halocynthiibacter namhaensis]
MYNIQSRTLVRAAVAATFISAGAAGAQDACSTYQVADGDTLATIALSAYGISDYQNIFNANRSVVSNPNLLESGLVLQLPCLDGSLPNGLTAEAVIQQQEQFQAARPSNNVYHPPMKIVTGNDWQPFADESLPGGGMMARLATTALQRGGNDREFSISFVDDWGSHLDVLLPLGAFDVSLAWTLPDCTKQHDPASSSGRRCNEFLRTVPVYETITAYFMRPDSPYANAQTYEDFRGSTFCRPEGYSTIDLEVNGMLPPALELMLADKPVNCIEAVMLGNADIAGMTPDLFETSRKELGITNDVVENPNVNYVTSYGFLISKVNPFGREYVAMLNRGLNEMRQSGEWYAIVSQSLRDHNEMLMATE